MSRRRKNDTVPGAEDHPSEPQELAGQDGQPQDDQTLQQGAMVACDVPGGVYVHLTEEFKNEAGGVERRRCGPQVLLAQGTNELDPEFWAEWLKQNERNPLVQSKTIRPADEH